MTRVGAQNATRVTGNVYANINDTKTEISGTGSCIPTSCQLFPDKYDTHRKYAWLRNSDSRCRGYEY